VCVWRGRHGGVAQVTELVVPGRDHFDIVEALADADAPLTVALRALVRM
jgi:hypothetical protein